MLHLINVAGDNEHLYLDTLYFQPHIQYLVFFIIFFLSHHYYITTFISISFMM